jgi:single-strand DNA-binding protein
MANLNKVLLMGNLTRDPELKMTPSGQAICKFGIAINRTFTGQDGQKREEVTFVDVDCFGKQAETIAKYCTRGKRLFVEGRLKLDTWEKNGEKKSKMGVILENFQFLGGKDESAAPASRQPAPPPAPKNDFAEDDSVPF